MPHLKLASNQAVLLHQKSFVIGSDPACDLALKNKDILPRHIIFQPRGEQWQIATLNLRAAVFINERPLTGIVILEDGDKIRIGSVTMVWREQDLQGEVSSPWQGLLSILLIVMVMMSALLAWFNFSDSPKPLPHSTPVILPTVPLKPHLQFQKLSENGHPLYEIIVPAPRR